MLFFERGKKKKKRGQAPATKNITGMNIDKALKLAVLITHVLSGSRVQLAARVSVSLCGPAGARLGTVRADPRAPGSSSPLPGSPGSRASEAGAQPTAACERLPPVRSGGSVPSWSGPRHTPAVLLSRPSDPISRGRSLSPCPRKRACW